MIIICLPFQFPSFRSSVDSEVVRSQLQVSYCATVKNYQN